MSLKRNIQVLAALAAVLAFSAIAASSALAVNDAPRWTNESVVPKTPLAGTEFTLSGSSTGDTNTTTGKLEVPGLFNLTNPAHKCTVHGFIAGSAVDTSGTVNNVTLICHEVDVEGNPKCTVESEPDNIPGTVKTKDLHGKTVWLEQTGHRTGVTFTPPVGKPVAELTLTGPECIFNGLTAPVTGTIIGEIENVTVDEKIGKLLFPDPPIIHHWTNDTPRVTAPTDGLKVANKAAAFTNTFQIKLLGEPLWGVETG